MNALNEVLSRIQPLFRGKDARISHEKRLAAQASLKDGDLTKSLALASQAVLRAPMTGNQKLHKMFCGRFYAFHYNVFKKSKLFILSLRPNLQALNK